MHFHLKGTSSSMILYESSLAPAIARGTYQPELSPSTGVGPKKECRKVIGQESRQAARRGLFLSRLPFPQRSVACPKDGSLSRNRLRPLKLTLKGSDPLHSECGTRCCEWPSSSPSWIYAHLLRCVLTVEISVSVEWPASGPF